MTKLDRETEARVRDVVTKIAASYARRCWWVEQDDLVQQGWAVALAAVAGAPSVHAAGLAHVAVRRSLSRYLWRLSAPVSASDHSTKKLRGVQRAPVSPDEPDRAPHPEALVGARRALQARPAIWERVRLHLGDGEYVDAVMAIYLDGVPPRAAAKRFGVPVEKLYRKTERARSAMRADRELYGMLAAFVAAEWT